MRRKFISAFFVVDEPATFFVINRLFVFLYKNLLLETNVGSAFSVVTLEGVARAHWNDLVVLRFSSHI